MLGLSFARDALIDVRSKRCNARILEEADQTQLRIKLALQHVMRLDEHERVRAKIEEPLIHSDLIRVQKFSQNTRDGGLCGALSLIGDRCMNQFFFWWRRREFASIELAIGQTRKAVQEH